MNRATILNMVYTMQADAVANAYAALAAEKEAETRATFDAIRTITQLRDDYAALAAENERLRKVGFRLAERLSWCGNLGDNPLIEEWQQITGTDVYKDDEGGAK